MNIWELQSACNGETIIWNHSVMKWCGVASLGEYDELYQLRDDLWDRYIPKHAESYTEQHSGICTVRCCDSPMDVLDKLGVELEALKDKNRYPTKKYVALDDVEKPVLDWVDRDYKPPSAEQVQKALAQYQVLTSALNAIRAIQNHNPVR